MTQSWNVVIDSAVGSLTFAFNAREEAEAFWRLLSEKWQQGNVQMAIDSENGTRAVKASELKGVWLTSWDEDDIAVSVIPT